MRDAPLLPSRRMPSILFEDNDKEEEIDKDEDSYEEMQKS